jgi:hypothetical protein
MCAWGCLVPVLGPREVSASLTSASLDRFPQSSLDQIGSPPVSKNRHRFFAAAHPSTLPHRSLK